MTIRPILCVFASLAAVGAASFAVAEAHDPVALREAKMTTVGQSTQIVGDMLRGNTPFDAAAANAALVAMRDAAQGFGELFPEGTELAGSNKDAAAPAIWENRADFDAEIAKFDAALEAAVAAEPQDMEALAAAFGPVGQGCRSCHQNYRVER
ncbi:cytochrome c [Halovulum dunhuangense]|uniref:Cytochrome c n=1 Tax=Halovulum dunhuangense TaxID=1505036 RepID=A0A849L4T6_9RHOB|nr:cytochrome c [Halovulum dunhuangense]NNU81210.1 cytochrome c [Halovulum dunhuangense]